MARLANQHIALSEDNGLVGTLGVGHAYFVLARVPRRLELHEERYFEDAPDFVGGPERRRSHIEDTNTGDCRLELSTYFVNGLRVNPAIHKGNDEGSIGHPHCLWLYGCVKARGTYNKDHSHRLIRDEIDSNAEAGFRSVKARGALVNSFTVGSWDKQAYLQFLKGLHKHVFATFTHKWLVFRLMYLYIAIARGEPDAAIGEEDHFLVLWTKCKYKPCGWQWESQTIQVGGSRMTNNRKRTFPGSHRSRCS